jgi:hypothetical protein
MDAENLTAFLNTTAKENQPSLPFFRITLVMLRVKFTKLNNGDAKVKLLTRSMEGSVFT